MRDLQQFAVLKYNSRAALRATVNLLLENELPTQTRNAADAAKPHNCSFVLVSVVISPGLHHESTCSLVLLTLTQ